MNISEYKAHEILDWIPSACADMAESQSTLKRDGFEVDGPTDADELYESEDTIYDLLVQQIHDKSGANIDLAISITKQILVISDHEVIKKCCVKFLNKMEE